MRLRDARKDLYRRLAHEEGYSSRAAYKLTQINSKYGIIRRGNCVIDFGAAPGGWLEVASKLVSTRGMVIGVDIVDIDPIAENVNSIVGDIYETGLEESILELLGCRADVVLSDLSPNISGIWEMDHSVQIDMAMRVVNMLPAILNVGGTSLLKAFDGPKLKSMENHLKQYFRDVKRVKPPASRSASSEIYLLSRRYRA